MLVLHRKNSEEVVIVCGDEHIVVTVVKTAHNRVILGFDAARHVRIVRRELFDGPASDAEKD